MTDLEDRLRAAMAASAEPAPARLLDGIQRRHRRHVRRVTVACVTAAAIGVAGTLVTREMLAAPAGTGPAGPAATGPALVPSAVPTSTATAAPGTVLRDCQSNDNGTLSSNWKAQSVQAGPVWFISVRPRNTPSSRQPLTVGRLTASAMVIAVSNGRRAVVTAAPATGGRFHFLANFHRDQRPYTLAEGAPGLTLAGCPATPAGTNIPAAYAAGLTMFWEGYVTDLKGCIPVEVRTSPSSQPIRVTLAAGNGGCGS